MMKVLQLLIKNSKETLRFKSNVFQTVYSLLRKYSCSYKNEFAWNCFPTANKAFLIKIRSENCN